jgi:integrase
MKLNKRTVDSIALPGKGQTFVWDDELKGFGIRLNPVGKTYVVQKRVSGTLRRVSIGPHGVLTVEQARKKAAEELVKMLNGIDPAEEKARKMAYAKTLQELAEDYIQAHRDLKLRSIADIRRHVDRSFSSWKNRPVVEITREKVAVRFRELSERSAAQANQSMRVLRALVNYARAAYRPDNKPILVENPVDIISQTKTWNRVAPKSRKIPLDKVGIAWNVLQTLRTDPAQTVISRAAADFVSFLMLNGWRLSDAAELTWDNVNLDEGWWHVEDPKNRIPMTLPLSNEAIAILDARKKDTPYVFASWGSTGHITVARRVTDKISSAIGTLVSVHDLRRTFVAIANASGVDFWKVKLLMGHKMAGDVTIHHYSETEDLRYLSDEINTIARWITTKALEAASDKVVPIRGVK